MFIYISFYSKEVCYIIKKDRRYQISTLLDLFINSNAHTIVFGDEDLKLCREEFEMVVDCLSDTDILTDNYVDFCIVMEEFDDPHGCLPFSWMLRNILSEMKSMKRIAPQEFEKLKECHDSYLGTLLSYYECDNEKRIVEYAKKNLGISKKTAACLEACDFHALATYLDRRFMSADMEILYRSVYQISHPDAKELQQFLVAHLENFF